MEAPLVTLEPDSFLRDVTPTVGRGDLSTSLQISLRTSPSLHSSPTSPLCSHELLSPTKAMRVPSEYKSCPSRCDACRLALGWLLLPRTGFHHQPPTHSSRIVFLYESFTYARVLQVLFLGMWFDMVGFCLPFRSLSHSTLCWISMRSQT